jgi:hypothetical protein
LLPQNDVRTAYATLVVLLVATASPALAQSALPNAVPTPFTAQQQLTAEQYELWMMMLMPSRVPPPTAAQLDQYFTNGGEATAVTDSPYFTNGAAVLAAPSSWGMYSSPVDAGAPPEPTQVPSVASSSSALGEPAPSESVANAPPLAETVAPITTPLLEDASMEAEAASPDAGVMRQAAIPSVTPLPPGVTWSSGLSPPPTPPAASPSETPTVPVRSSPMAAPKSLVGMLAFIAWCATVAGVVALAAFAVWIGQRHRTSGGRKHRPRTA